MSKTYVTIQGDMWDAVDKRTLGSEYYMVELIEANPEHRKTVIFSANVELVIPEVAPPVPTKQPPWKRGNS